MKNLLHYLTIALSCSLLLFACQGESLPKLQPLNLMSYGFPITIMAPDSASVDKSLGGIIEELTVKGKGNFGLLVQSSMATETDAKVIKSEELELVKERDYFSKLIQDDENGFLYETVIDSVNISYEFFKVKVQGDKEYRFRTPYTGSYTEKEAKRIYGSLADMK